MSLTHLPLTLNKLSITLAGQSCLQNISTTIEQDGITAIIGANGSGKTVLLKACAGLIPPSAGHLQWQNTPRAPELGFVPQQSVLLKRSVQENILLPLRYHKMSSSTERCKQAMEWADILHLKDQTALDLSTGEQQLVAIARAWSLQPKILLLDEPTANLDPERQQQINTLLQEMTQDCKLILSTHSLSQARAIAGDILLLNRGKLATHQPTDDFFHSNPFGHLGL